jgi:predicted nucleic-acid-binding protein
VSHKPIILDANAVIHFILDDDREKSMIVANILNENECIVPLEVMAETVYILTKIYNHSRQMTADKIKDFVAIKEDLITEDALIHYSLNLYATTNLDFVDCLLDGYAKINGYSVFTFDDKLRKQLMHKFYREKG